MAASESAQIDADLLKLNFDVFNRCPVGAACARSLRMKY